jgi:hypothetical protein
MHGYWDHPRFPRKMWDPADWTINNTPMARDQSGGSLTGLARHRLHGLPFTVSEYNHPAPNDYQAECLPMIAAFAASQDWDGLYLFNYNSDGNYACDRLRGAFTADTNPAQMALLPAAAMLFLRGDVPPAPEEAQLLVPEGSVVELIANRRKNLGYLWEEAYRGLDARGNRAQLLLGKRLSLSFVPGKKGEVTLRRGGVEGEGPIRSEGAGTDRALFTADSLRSKVMVGYLGGRTVELPGWRVQGGKNGKGFATLALTAMDGKPLTESRSLLLTAVGRVENKGMGWNAARTSVGDRWGDGPTQAEGVAATVSIATQANSATVHALDGAGKRRGRVESTLADGRLTFTLGPVHRTLWYEVEAGGRREARAP